MGCLELRIRLFGFERYLSSPRLGRDGVVVLGEDASEVPGAVPEEPEVGEVGFASPSLCSRNLAVRSDSISSVR